MRRFAIAWAPALALGVALGCGAGEEPSAGAGAPANGRTDPSKYMLSSEPADPQGVADLRESARDGDDVVMMGRIGGMENPWLDGYVGFTLVDPSVKHCHELGDDGCSKPWDYC